MDVNEQEQGQCMPSAAEADVGGVSFAEEEWQTLLRLRATYEEGADLLSQHERTALRFVRWLVENGRLEP